MNLRKVEFQPKPLKYGVDQKYAEITYELEGYKMNIELVMTEYAGDKEHDAYFSVDFMNNGKTFHGDEFETLEEALDDTEYRIVDAFDNEETLNELIEDSWSDVG